MKIATIAGSVLKTVGLSIMVFLSLLQPTTMRASQSFAVLADHGRAEYKIILGASASEVERFAGEELQKYLTQIAGAAFSATKDGTAGNVIMIGRGIASGRDLDEATLGFDGFVIDIKPGKIVLAGVNDRATLFSVYAFLEKMGCRWFAPNFDFYGRTHGEFVPSLKLLRVPVGTTRLKSTMKYRKEDIGEGRTHTVTNIRQIIDWMPKVRMNVLQAPLDYGGRGAVVWDKWRLDLIPDLRKRGLLVEIGGHGYQDYLPQAKYFAAHSEWFGMVDGRRSADERLVFESANPDAMAEFLKNIRTYLRAHPEIDIFDLWPPDGVRWSESPESRALGTPPQRHALIVNTVARMAKREFPRLIIEFLAYEDYISPPRDIVFEDNTTLDFCPIARSFQVPLWDKQNDFNRPYSQALDQWLKRDVFKGDISIYTYYRKYAWRSLPIVIPRLIGEEAKHYQAMGVNGMGLYSEPGNWFTYELSNYIFSRVTFDSSLNMDDEISDYSQRRFGPASGPLSRYFETIEAVGPVVLRIPGTVVLDQLELERGMEQLGQAADLLTHAAQLSAGDDRVQELVTKFQRELDYATNDLQIRLVAWKLSRGPTFSDETPHLGLLLKQRRDLLEANENQGLFVIAGPHVLF